MSTSADDGKGDKHSPSVHFEVFYSALHSWLSACFGRAVNHCTTEEEFVGLLRPWIQLTVTDLCPLSRLSRDQMMRLHAAWTMALDLMEDVLNQRNIRFCDILIALSPCDDILAALASNITTTGDHHGHTPSHQD